MAQTGTGKARDKLILRARVLEFITGPTARDSETAVYWQDDDPGFPSPPMTSPPDPPASFIWPQQNATFPFRGTTTGEEIRQGSWSILAAVQTGRPGVDAQMALLEADIRLLADAGHPDANTEDLWTEGPVETNERVEPNNVPEAIRKAFRFDQFVIPYMATEIGR